MFEDIRELTRDRLDMFDALPDIVTGGFPCQDISLAGKGAGLGGERSGLWWEMHRVIAETRPRWVVAENVAALRSRGLDQVLGSLAAIGYDAEWHCIPASAVGAPHRRDRIWIVAYPARLQSGWPEQRAIGQRTWESGEPQPMADAQRAGLEGRAVEPGNDAEQCSATQRGRALPHANSEPQGRLAIAWSECGQWLAEPDVGRVAHGVPARVDRLRALGNAVVPQIPEIIARAIADAERRHIRVTG